MLRLNKKVEYGLMSMMHMDSTKDEVLATVRKLSKIYSIPMDLLGKVMQSLAKAHLIFSTQGARGGYRLARRLEQITLGEVVEAMEGRVHIGVCQDDPASCKQYSTCNIKRPILQLRKTLMDYMYGLPLSEFRSKLVSGQASYPRADTTKPINRMFTGRARPLGAPISGDKK